MAESKLRRKSKRFVCSCLTKEEMRQCMFFADAGKGKCVFRKVTGTCRCSDARSAKRESEKRTVTHLMSKKRTFFELYDEKRYQEAADLAADIFTRMIK